MIAIDTIPAFLTHLYAGGFPGNIPITHFVITQDGFLGLKVIAILAIPAFFRQFYTSTGLGFIPIPQHVVHHFDLLYFIMVTVLTIPTQLSILCTRRRLGFIPIAIAMISVVIQLGDIKVGIAIQIYPTANESAPRHTVHDYNREDLHLISRLQGGQRTVIRAGTGANIQVIIGYGGCKSVGQHLIIVQQNPLIQLHPTAFVSTPKLLAEIDTLFDQDQFAFLQRSHFRIGGMRTLIDLHTGGAENGGINGNFHFLAFISMDTIRAGHFEVICMLQRNPAFIKATPQAAALLCQTGNQQFLALVDCGYDAAGDAGCLTHIDILTGDLNLHTAFRVCGLIRSHRTQFPMGIQSDAVGGLIQGRDPGAAGRCGEPANEGITRPCGYRHRCGGHIAIIGLGAAVPVATIGIEPYIAIAFGQFSGVCTVQIDISFHHTATQQTI